MVECSRAQCKGGQGTHIPSPGVPIAVTGSLHPTRPIPCNVTWGLIQVLKGTDTLPRAPGDEEGTPEGPPRAGGGAAAGPTGAFWTGRSLSLSSAHSALAGWPAQELRPGQVRAAPRGQPGPPASALPPAAPFLPCLRRGRGSQLGTNGWRWVQARAPQHPSWSSSWASGLGRGLPDPHRHPLQVWWECPLVPFVAHKQTRGSFRLRRA